MHHWKIVSAAVIAIHTFDRNYFQGMAFIPFYPNHKIMEDFFQFPNSANNYTY